MLVVDMALSSSYTYKIKINLKRENNNQICIRKLE